MKTTRKILIVDMPDGDELVGAYGWRQVGGNLLRSELVYYAAKEITPPSTVQKGGTEMSKQEEFKQWLLGYSGVKSLPENFDYELAQFVNEAITEHEAGKKVIKAKAVIDTISGRIKELSSHQMEIYPVMDLFVRSNEKLIDIEIIVKEGGE